MINISSCDYITFILAIHQLLDIFLISTFWLLWTMLTWTFVCWFLCGHVFHFSWYIYLYMYIYRSGSSVFNHLRNCQTFPKQLHHFLFLPVVNESSDFSISPLTLGWSFCYSRPSSDISWFWFAFSQMTYDSEHPFTWLFVFFWRMFIWIFWPIFNWFIYFWVVGILCIYSKLKFLVRYILCKNFLPIFVLSFSWWCPLKHRKVNFDDV